MISKANPINLSPVGVEGVQVDQDYTYVQQWLSTSTLRLQIQSNTEPVVKLIDSSYNETTITPVQVADYTDKIETGPCFLQSAGSGVTAISFVNGLLPYWLVAGQNIAIVDGANDGTYTITETAYDDIDSTFVAKFAHTYTASGYQPTFTATISTGLDVWECSVTLSGLSTGCYYIDVDGQESNYFELSTDMKHITYSNSFDNFQVLYSTGIGFEFDIVADLFDLEAGGEIAIYSDDEQQEQLLDTDYFRTLTFQAERVPGWVCEHLDLIFSHDNVEIDGIGFQVAEKGSRELIDGTNLFDYTINLQQVSDYAIGDVENFILISNDGFLLPNANGRVPYE